MESQHADGNVKIGKIDLINVELTIMAAVAPTLDIGVAGTERAMTHAKVEKSNTDTVRRRLSIDIMSNIGSVNPTSITTATKKNMASIAAETFTNQV
eukprot:jgi/Picsp_1/1992/NSC_05458-R1_---NA---